MESLVGEALMVSGGGKVVAVSERSVPPAHAATPMANANVTMRGITGA
jgi:hypothetical protein